jgi:gliding motility-associated-like protein
MRNSCISPRQFIYFISILIFSSTLSAQTPFPSTQGGQVTTSTTLTRAQSPYIVSQNILVAGTATLTIEQGVEVRFNLNTKIEIAGRIMAIGGVGADTIVFTGSTSTTKWQGLQMTGTAPAGSVFKYVKFENADGSLTFGGVTMERCRFTQNQIIDFNSASTIDYCNFSLQSNLNVNTASQLRYSEITKGSSSGGGMWWGSGRIALNNDSTRAIGNKIQNLSNQIEVNSGTVFIKNTVIGSTGSYAIYVNPRGRCESNYILGTNNGATAGIYCRSSWDSWNSAASKIRFNVIGGFKDNIYVQGDGQYSMPILEYNTFIGTLDVTTERNLRANGTFSQTSGNTVAIPATNSFWRNYPGDSITISNTIEDGNDSYQIGAKFWVLPTASSNNALCPILPPVNVEKFNESGLIKVKWNKNTESDLAGYRIYTKTNEIFTLAGTITNTADSSFAFSTGSGISLESDIYVTAFDNQAVTSTYPQGDIFESQYSQANLRPEAPSNLTISKNRRLTISWEASATPSIDAYYVYRKTETSTYARIGATNLLTYTDSTALQQVRYYYKISAFDSLGINYSGSGLESSFSNEVNDILSAYVATRIYVDSLTGNNSNPGSESAPIKTIQAAFNMASAGDTIIISDHVYKEQIIIPTSQDRKTFTLVSRYIFDGDTTHINRAILDGSSFTATQTFLSGNVSLRIRGITLSKMRGTMISLSSGSNSGGPMNNTTSTTTLDLLRVKISEMGTPGTTGSTILEFSFTANDIRVDSSTMTANQNVRGLFAPVDTFSLRNSRFTNNRGGVLKNFNWNGSRAHIERNTFSDNTNVNTWSYSEYALIDGVRRLNLRRNTFVRNDMTVIGRSTEANFQLITNNVFFRNRTGLMRQSSYSYSDTTYLTHNTFIGNATDVSFFYQNKYVAILYNNIFNGDVRFEGWAPSNQSDFFRIHFRRNIFKTYPVIQSAIIVDTTEGNFVRPNVYLVDTANLDFRLANWEFAIAKGHNFNYPVNTTDFNLGARPLPVASRPDIGAIENIARVVSPRLTYIEPLNNKVIINWEVASPTDIGKFYIFRSTSPIDSSVIGTLTPTYTVGTLTQTQFEDVDITNGSRYYYRMQSAHSTNQSIVSGASNQMDAMPDLVAGVTSLTASNGPNRVRLMWTGSAPKYQIYRSTDSTSKAVLTDTVTQQSFIDSMPARGTRYYYWVRGMNLTGAVSEISPVVFTNPSTIWHVNTTTGSNTTGIGSASFPLATINRAADISTLGDTIVAYPGIYRERVDLKGKVSMLASRFLLSGDTADISATRINGNFAGSSMGNLLQSVVPNNWQGSPYHVYGLTFEEAPGTITNLELNYQMGGTSSGTTAVQLQKISRSIIRNNGLTSNWATLFNVNMAGVIDSCVFYGNRNSTIIRVGGNNSTSEPAERRPQVINSTFYSNGNSSGGMGSSNYIVSISGSGRPRIINNLFYRNSINPIAIVDSPSDSIFILHNTVADNTAYGLWFSGPTWMTTQTYTAVVQNNIFSGNTQGNLYSSINSNSSGFTAVIASNLIGTTGHMGGTGLIATNITRSDTTGNIGGIPQFIDTASSNYRLQPWSPLIGAGTASSTALPVKDMVGNARIFSGRTKPDLGAFESSHPFPAPNFIRTEPENRLVRLVWNHATPAAITGYRIYRSASSIPDTSTIAIYATVAGALSTTYVDTATNGVTYYYRIKSANAAGALSSFSRELSARPDSVAAPTDFVLSNGPNRARLTWTGTSPRYQVYRSLDSTASALLTDTITQQFFIDSMPVRGNRYYYWVRGMNATGAVSAISEVRFTTPSSIWHVNGTAGSNATGLGSAAFPLATINKAADNASLGDTVVVYPGVYKERIDLRGKIAMLASRFLLTRDTADISAARISGNFIGSGNSALVQSTTSSAFHLYGLTFEEAQGPIVNLETQTMYGGSASGTTNVQLQRLSRSIIRNNGNNNSWGNLVSVRLGGIVDSCIFYGNRYDKLVALEGWGSSSDTSSSLAATNALRRPQLLNSTFYSNSSPSGGINSGNYAISVSGDRTRPRVINNLVYNNRISGIGVINTPTDSLIILNNTVANNSGYGLTFSTWNSMNTYTILVQNNIFYGNTQRDIYSGISTGNNLGFSAIIKNNVLGASGHLGGTGMIALNITLLDTTGNIGGDPVFVDTSASNYRVQAWSAIIGRGATSSYLPAKDIAGNTRIGAGRTKPDLGAFESAFAFSAPNFLRTEPENRRVGLFWTQNLPAGISGYRIYRSRQPIPDTSTLAPLATVEGSSTLSFIDSVGVTNRDTFYYRIKSADISTTPVLSPFSRQLIAIPDSVPPVSNLVVVNGPKRARLTWQSQATTYDIYRSTDSTSKVIFKQNITDTSYVDTSLVRNTRYYYWVRARNVNGALSDYSNRVDLLPTNIWYVKVGTGSNTLNMGAPTLPLLTISYAISQSINGDTVLMLPGIYNERVTVNKQITIASRYILDNTDTAAKTSTIIDGQRMGIVVRAENPNSKYIGFTIRNGFSSVGAGLYNTQGVVEMRHMRVTDCTATGDIDGGGAYFTGKALIYDCEFLRNTGRKGGAIVLNGIANDTVKVFRTVFKYNQGNENGSAIIVFGANNSSILINNCIFAKNTGANPIHSQGSSTTTTFINHSNFFNNNAAAIFMASGNVVVRNSILRGNATSEVASTIGPNTGPVTITYSNVKGGYTGTGNINVDPLFADTNYIKLLNNSLCIGAGDSTVRVNEDFFKFPRPTPTGSKPDIGAYESLGKFPSPSLTSVEPGNRKVTVFWNQTPPDGIIGYKLYRSESSISDTATLQPLIVISGVLQNRYLDTTSLVNGTTYYYRIRSFDADSVQSGYSNELSARPDFVAVPAGLTISNSPATARATWDSVSGTGTRYRLYRGTDSTASSTLIDMLAAVSHNDTTIARNTTYFYSVRAINSTGAISEYSPYVQLTPTRRWYVDSTLGNNTTGIGSQASPFKTIARAVQRTVTLDSIMIGNGTYSENISYSNKQLSFIGINGARQVILRPQLQQQIISMTANAGYSLFKGLTFTGGVSSAAGSAIYSRLSNPIIENCIFRNNQGQILQFTANNFIIRNCLVYNNNANVFIDLSNQVDSIPYIYNLTYTNNQINWLYNTGITSYPPAFKNCIIWGSSAINYGGGMTVENSIYKGGFPLFNTNLDLSPEFVDSANADFRLRNYSPAIGLGATDVVLSKDFADSTRPNPAGSNPDAGAFESIYDHPSPFINADSSRNGFVLLKWIQAPFNAVSKFKVYKGTSSSSMTLYDSTGLRYNYTDSANTINNTILFYGLTSLGSGIQESGISNIIRTISFTPPGLVLPADQLTDADTTITFRWNAIPNAQRYKLQLSVDSTFQSNVSEFTTVDTFFTRTGLLGNTFYFWRVRSQDTVHYSKWSNSRRFLTFVLPPKMTRVTPANKQDTLSWTNPNGFNIAYFKIYRDTAAGASVLIDSVPGTQLQYLDTLGLELNRRYYYRIKAVNTQGIHSDFSNEMSAVPFNKRPENTTLPNKEFPNVGEFNFVRCVYSAQGSYDPDGQIVAYQWYVNDSLVSVGDSILIYYYGRGTNKLRLITEDNDGARDTADATIILKTFAKQFTGGILGGITAVSPNIIYTADSTFSPTTGAQILRLDRMGNTVYPLIVNQKIFTTPSVASDSSVFITSGSSLNGFNKAGVSLWPTIPLGGLSLVTPTVDSMYKRIYVGVSNKNFQAINYLTGAVVWSYLCDAPINVSAVITGNRRLVFVSESGRLYGFNIVSDSAQTAPKWEYNLGEIVTKTGAVDLNNDFYFGTTSGKLIKIRLHSNGTVSQLWSTNLNAPVESSPVLDARGDVYVGTNQGVFYKVNPANGQVLWTRQSQGAIKATPAVTDYGSIVFATTEGHIVAVDTLNRVKWSHKENNPISANLLYIDNVVYVGTQTGNFIGLYDNPNTNTVNTSLSYRLPIRLSDADRTSLCAEEDRLVNIIDLSEMTADRPAIPVSGIDPTPPIWGTFQGNYRRTGSRSLDCPETPTINITGTRTICQGDVVELTTTSTTNSFWEFNGTIIANSSTSLSAREAGIYRRVNQNDNGCKVFSGSVEVIVNPLPARPLVTTSGALTFCEGESVQFASSSSSNNAWFRVGTTQVLGAFQSYNANVSGQYFVRVVNSNGCYSYSDTIAVTVNPKPAVPVVASSALSFCVGDSLTLSTTSTNSRQWLNGGVAITNATGENYIVRNAGFYSLRVTNASGCFNTSASLEIAANALPTVTVTTAPISATVCSGGQITLTASGASSYSWTGGVTNGVAFTPSQSGTYVVTGTDANGCRSQVVRTITVNPLPSVNIGAIPATSAVCQGGSILLIATGGSTYSWTGGVTNGVSFTPSQTGTYTVTATDANGCVNSAAQVVVVNPLPVISIATVPATATVCSGSPVILTASGATTYNWSGSLTNGVAFNPTQTNSYTVIGTDANGCSSQAQQAVTVNPLPTITIASNPINGTVCVGDPVTLVASGASSYSWSGGITNGVPFTPTQSGTYVVTGSDALGCSRSVSSVVTVLSLPTAQINAPANSFICDGTSVTLTATGTGNSYQWYINNTEMPGQVNASINAVAEGAYTVVTRSASGCRSVPSNAIVMTLQRSPQVAFAYDKYCVDAPTQFTNQSVTTNSGPVQWEWNFGFGATSTLAQPTHTFTIPGIYTVSLKATPVRCPSLAKTETRTITVDKPQAGIRYPFVKAIENTPTALSARNFGASYQWSPTTGLTNATTVNPTFNAGNPQDYLIRITSISGCVTTDTLSVYVFKESGIYVPKAFSPNGDGQNERLYPELVNIASLQYFRVYNRWGQLVYETRSMSTTGWDGTFNGVKQPMDTYTWFAVGTDKNGKVVTANGQTLLMK